MVSPGNTSSERCLPKQLQVKPPHLSAGVLLHVSSANWCFWSLISSFDMMKPLQRLVAFVVSLPGKKVRLQVLDQFTGAPQSA